MSTTLKAKSRDDLNAMVAEFTARGGQVTTVKSGRGNGWSKKEWDAAVKGEGELKPREASGERVSREAEQLMERVREAYHTGGYEAALAIVTG